MIRLTEILKNEGIFSKEIKQRLSNGQIMINGEVVREDIVIEDIDIFNRVEIDELIFNLCKNPINAIRLQIFGLENIINSNIKNELTEILDDFIIIRTSKKHVFAMTKLKRKHKQV